MAQVVAVRPPGTTGTTQTTIVPGGPTAAPGAGLVGTGGAGPSPAPIGVGAPTPAPQQNGATAPAVPQPGPAKGPMLPTMPAGPLKMAGTAMPPCQAILGTERASLPDKGGTVQVKVDWKPANCKLPPAVPAGWVHLREPSEPGAMNFVVDPNRTARIRQTAIAFGKEQFVIGQAAGRGIGIAASPGKFEFNLKPKRSDKKSFRVWSDDSSLVYSVKTVGQDKWLRVNRSLAKNLPGGSARFEVAVDTAGLSAGRHEATIEIAAPEAANSPIEIPVVLNVWPK